MLIHTLAQRFDPPAHVGLLQRGDPVGKPWLQLLKLHPLDLTPPRRNLLVVLLIAAQLHEIHPVTAYPPPMRRACSRANSSHSQRQYLLRK